MMNLTPELIEQAKAANSPEELMALAKENNMELTEEEATAYFQQFHLASGELSDDELDSVSGGGCHTGDGRLVVSMYHFCSNWKCDNDGSTYKSTTLSQKCSLCGDLAVCDSCKYCTYEKGLWLCNHPANRK